MSDTGKIYVIDDDAGARTAITALLHEYNYDTEVFESAERFLSVFNKQLPGCIILDVQMPGMTGIELQDALLSKDIFTPIIFVTGHGTISWSVQAMKKGASNFLEKPYDEDVLIQSIKEALEQDKINRQLNVNCKSVANKYQTLTNREKQVLEYLVFGSDEATNKMIAKKMDISHRTVEEYRAEAMRKMNAKSLKELVTMAVVCKLLNSRPGN